MVTKFEEAINLVDASMNILTMAQINCEAEPVLAGVLWGVSNMLERALDIMGAIEAEKETGLDAFPTAQDTESETWINVTVPREELVKMEQQTIAFEELANEQFNESETREAAEHHESKGKTVAVPTENEGGTKVDLRKVHNLRMQGKKAAEIAAGFGVTTQTVYGWFKQIKQKHPNWVEEWNRR